MLLIDDGDLAHVLMDPKAPISYSFIAHIPRILEPNDPRLESLVKGIELKPGQVVRVDSCTVESIGERGTLVRLDSSEGRSKQLRSMFNVVGLKLEALTRTGLSGVELDGLPEGELRELTPDEQERLWSLVGGQQSIVQKRVEALTRHATRLAEQGRPHERLERWLADQ